MPRRDPYIDAAHAYAESRGVLPTGGTFTDGYKDRWALRYLHNERKRLGFTRRDDQR